MKSIKQQYIDLREGNMSQANFMRNIRMSLPQYISNVTSYNDSVKILRNKGILSEADISAQIMTKTVEPQKQEQEEDVEILSSTTSNELTSDNNEFHRDGFTMGFYEGEGEDKDGEQIDENDTSSGPNAQWLGSIKDIIEDMFQNGQINNYAEYGSAMTKLSQNPEGIVSQYGETSAADAAAKIIASVAGAGDEYDPGPGEDEDFERDYDTDYEEPRDDFPMSDYNDGEFWESLNEAKDEKGKWTNADGKTLYAQFKEMDNQNGQELLTGLDWEMEKNPELTKMAAAKTVIKNLKKNPIYYTMADLAGKEGAEAQYMGPKADVEARQMQFLDKNMSNVVDKKMGMKPVKDVEKVKASANKAKKETNTAEKGISLMSLIAKSVRGIQKMDATGEKMKKIVMKEGMEGQYTFNGKFKGGELAKLKAMVPDAEIDVEEQEDTVKTTVSSKQYNDKTIGHAVKQVMGMNVPIKDKKDLGGSFDKFKSQLKELIRKEIAGAYGGDQMDAEDGSSYTNELIRFYDDDGNPIQDEEGKPGVVVKSQKKR
jgi:hypothetical protein